MRSLIRWLAALAICTLAFVLFNWLFAPPRALLRLRSPSANAQLTRAETTEILLRGGGLRQVPNSDFLNSNDPRAMLLSTIGVVVTFEPDENPDLCYIKWFPKKSRPDLSAAAAQPKPSSSNELKSATVDEARKESEVPVADPQAAVASATDATATDATATDSTTTAKATPANNTAEVTPLPIKDYWDVGPDERAYTLILHTERNYVRYAFSYGGQKTEWRTLLVRHGHWMSPIRPVDIESELSELVDEFLNQITELHTSRNWRTEFIDGKKSESKDIPNESESQIIARTLEGVFAIIFSEPDVSAENVDPARPLPSLQEETLLSRVINGSNWLGVIQLLIATVFVRGLIATCSVRGDSYSAELGIAKTAIETLPALGFLGTLLGMALAFSAGLDDRNNLTQSLTLAISTSAVALLGALFLVWMLHYVDKTNCHEQ